MATAQIRLDDKVGGLCSYSRLEQVLNGAHTLLLDGLGVIDSYCAGVQVDMDEQTRSEVALELSDSYWVLEQMVSSSHRLSEVGVGCSDTN